MKTGNRRKASSRVFDDRAVKNLLQSIKDSVIPEERLLKKAAKFALPPRKGPGGTKRHSSESDTPKKSVAS